MDRKIYHLSQNNPTSVSFNQAICCIECSGCGQKIPLSRHTCRNPHLISEEMQMARAVHEDCIGLSESAAKMRRTWREGWLRQQHCGGGVDRRVYSV